MSPPPEVGIGVELSQDAFGVFVQQVYRAGPAHFSGAIAVGDYVEDVDGQAIINEHEASRRLSGAAGTIVEVRVRQGGGGDSTNVYLLRQDVNRERTDGDEGKVGIAAALRVVRDGVVVDTVIPGGPAFLSGAVHEGYLITAIDGAKITGNFHSNEISDIIRGKEGTRLTIECIAAERRGRPRDRTNLKFVDLVRSLLESAAVSF